MLLPAFWGVHSCFYQGVTWQDSRAADSLSHHSGTSRWSLINPGAGLCDLAAQMVTFTQQTPSPSESLLALLGNVPDCDLLSLGVSVLPTGGSRSWQCLFALTLSAYSMGEVDFIVQEAQLTRHALLYTYIFLSLLFSKIKTY